MPYRHHADMLAHIKTPAVKARKRLWQQERMRDPEFKMRHKALVKRASTRRKKLTAMYLQEVKTKPCMDCGGTFPTVCMDFDHRPGEKKLFSVSKDPSRNLNKTKAEVAKCDLVCANCHRIRTFARRKHEKS